jgi:hypothetical protein
VIVLQIECVPLEKRIEAGGQLVAVEECGLCGAQISGGEAEALPCGHVFSARSASGRSGRRSVAHSAADVL